MDDARSPVGPQHDAAAAFRVSEARTDGDSRLLGHPHARAGGALGFDVVSHRNEVQLHVRLIEACAGARQRHAMNRRGTQQTLACDQELHRMADHMQRTELTVDGGPVDIAVLTDRAMLLQVLAYLGTILDDRNTARLQLSATADAGAHQDRRAANSAGAYDDLASRLHLMKLATPRVDNTDSTTPCKHNPLDLRTRDHVQIPA